MQCPIGYVFASPPNKPKIHNKTHIMLYCSTYPHILHPSQKITVKKQSATSSSCDVALLATHGCFDLSVKNVAGSDSKYGDVFTGTPKGGSTSTTSIVLGVLDTTPTPPASQLQAPARLDALWNALRYV
jgi:hypothetical protein